MRTATRILLALTLVLALAGCGDDDDPTRSERPDIEDDLIPTVEGETDDGADEGTDDGLTVVEPTPTAVVTEIEPERLTYTVQQGDLLGGIAQTFGVPLGALIAVNDLENPDFIQVGQEVLIPTDEEVAEWEAAQDTGDGGGDGGAGGGGDGGGDDE